MKKLLIILSTAALIASSNNDCYNPEDENQRMYKLNDFHGHFPPTFKLNGTNGVFRFQAKPAKVFVIANNLPDSSKEEKQNQGDRK